MHCSRTVAMVVALAGLIPAYGSSYDAALDFAQSNPNGVWSYGSLTGDAGSPLVSSFSLFDNYQANGVAGVLCDPDTMAGPCGINSWFGESGGASLPPTIAGNTTGDYISYLTITHPFYDVLLYPGQSEYVDLRWTAPRNGYYNVLAQFEGIDYGSDNGPTVDVYIFLNTDRILSESIAGSYGVAWMWAPSPPQFFRAGDTVDFVVGSQGDNVSDGTGLSASFSDTPEPSTVLLIGAGLLLPLLKRNLGGRS